MNRLVQALAIAVLSVAACGDDSGGTNPDSALPVPDAATPDSNAFDAPIDAFVPCFGQALFTGEYVDWDSTPMSFLGIPDATATEVGNPGNTATTAPNGRVILCLTPNADADVTFTQASYLPMTFSAHADIIPLGMGYSTKGLTPARATSLAAELSVASFTGTQVLVELKEFAAETPTSGVTVDLAGNTYEKAFALNDSGQWIESTTSGAAGYVLFTNVVDDGDGSAALTVTPGGGVTCTARSTVTLVDGGIAATSVHCQ